MQVNGYSNAIANRYLNNAGEQKPISNQNSIDKAKVDAAVNKFDSELKLVSSKERKFFKNMFPENAAQLDKHVLFNRNGRVQTANMAKGSIFDAKI